MSDFLPPGTECLGCGNVYWQCECPRKTISRPEMDEDEYMEYISNQSET